MPANRSLLLIGLPGVIAGAILGCRNTPPPRVPVPSSSGGNPYTTYERDAVKPLRVERVRCKMIRHVGKGDAAGRVGP